MTRALRAAAIAIAALAAIDPALTRTGVERATVAVIAAGAAADSAAAARVRAALAGDFAVVPGTFGGARATVVVGEAVPVGHEDLAGPVFAVTPGASTPRVTIERVDAPRRVPLESRVAVQAGIRVRGAQGRTLDVTLRSGGLAVSTVSRRIASNDTHLDLPLSFAPLVHGGADLRVLATLSGARADSAFADLVVDVTPDAWKVLFHDGRPSWSSTFVRRTIERDPRFSVASRIGTSRDIASDAGRPPRLDDRVALGGVDLIVVGAPDALAAEEVGAIDRFLRRRGGSVVLLLDAPPQPGSWILGFATGAEWRQRSGGDALPIGRAAADSASLRAIELAWPARLLAGAEPIAFTNVGSARDTARHAVVWGTPVGAGRLVVSGALDAWRYRDASHSSFDTFWRELLAHEAGRAAPSVAVSVAPDVLEPGARGTVTVTLRDPAITAASTSGWTANELRASLSASADGPVHLWPTASVGVLGGGFRAPDGEGAATVRVVAGRDTTRVPIVVKSGARTASAPSASALSAWAASTGGGAFGDHDLDRLRGAMRTAIAPETFTRPWHPMRSAWWIVPFALLLSAEWLHRRRRGLA